GRRAPRDRPAYDFVVQAESGLMSITGEPDGEPTKVGVALVDVLAGLNAATAILAALHRRGRTGEGELIEISLLDSAFAGLVNVAENALVTGEEPRRYGNAHPSIVPYQPFRTTDGWIAIALLTCAPADGAAAARPAHGRGAERARRRRGPPRRAGAPRSDRPVIRFPRGTDRGRAPTE